MGRWPGGARERLQEAALALFAERGYSATTVDEIADRAGVSQRTFFRHFPDKEEVLFGADDHLTAVLVAGIRAAPADASARDLVAAGLRALAAELQPRRETLRVRARVLASDIALQGRDLAKQARWRALVADEAVARGVPAASAALLAAAGAGALQVAYADWLADASRTTLVTRFDRALETLAASLTGADPRPPRS